MSGRSTCRQEGRLQRQFVENDEVKKPTANDDHDASLSIDQRIAGLADWRGQTLSAMRKLILGAAPNIVEEVKWRKPSNDMLGVPVWSCEGIICTGETYKDKVKLTFAKGGSLEDAAKLFNASLEGSTRRAIDIHEGVVLDARAFQALVRAAVTCNTAPTRAKPTSKTMPKR